jgi:uncharacterized protein (DUF1697 family)
MKYVVFLRGINVGGRIVKMAELKTCLEKAGLKNVKTILQTGNVIFECDKTDISKLKQMIEAALTKSFNYPAKVQVFPAESLHKIIKGYPFGIAGVSQHDYVVFMENGLEKDILKEEFSLAVGEKVQAGVAVVYWRIDKGNTLKSDFAKQLTKSRYKNFNTNRNLKTLQKIIAT